MTEYYRRYFVTPKSIDRCGSKRVYQSWSDAEAAAVTLLDDLRDGKLPIQKEGNVFAYRCGVCGRWHVGHQPRPSNPWNDWHQHLVSRQQRQARRDAKRGPA